MPDTGTGTAEPPEVTDEQSADIETVAALLSPHFPGKLTLAPGERDGDVIVRPADRGDRWLVQQSAATLREAGVRVRQEDDHVIALLWPYDAVRNDPLTALRIPVVRKPYPDWRYEVCVVISDDESSYFGPALRPDEREVAQILAEIEWRMLYYRDSYAAKMRRRPLDMDGTTNTVVLLKRAEGDWCYRRDSWSRGPLMVPSRDVPPETLEQILDRCNDYGGEPNPKWREFKAAHPEAFGEVPDGS